MPNRRYSLLPALLCLPLGILAGVLAHGAIVMRWELEYYLDTHYAHREAFRDAEIAGLVDGFSVICGMIALAALVASLVGLFRRRLALAWLRKTYGAVYVLVAITVYVIFALTAAHAGGVAAESEVPPSAMTIGGWRWSLLWPLGGAALLFAALHVTAWRRKAIALYERVEPDQPCMGDRIVENIRTHGRDPLYRKSVLSSVSTHLAIIILPLLLDVWGCVQNYLVPHGSGTPTVSVVQVVKKKKKKKKKLVLNPNSAIYFHVPDLDDSDILREVEDMTQLTYVADPNAMAGKMGAGGGKKGGWPEGTGNEPIRFIRMEYNGRDWDDGMDPNTRADVNFLEEFRRLTGFKVARRSESHAIRLLRKYDKGYAPPFVYMTGSAHISVPQSDMKVMREYLLDGGLLFADCGSRHWDRSFRGFAKALFPDKRLVVIADDDPIFQMPYAFPNGAPPLWHHGGHRALGIKHKGRWCVFYHPGDINDAWKTGHSGMDSRLAKGAFQMGVNIVYYSFTHYLAMTRKYRK
jgi:hypothetical protein